MAEATSPRRPLFKMRSTRLALGILVVGLAAFWFLKPESTPPDRGTGELMKAVVYHEYGPPGVLRVEQVEKLLPNDSQVLIKVRAAAANPLDWHYMRRSPYLVRLGAGLRKPKKQRLGVDMAGVVELVGSKVTKFKPGDEVFGAAGGAFGEYARASENRVALKPANLSFEQAAAVPVAGLTALEGLRKAKVQRGQKVLVNGASAGVGTFAVQIAKAFGADVTGVCSRSNLDLVRSIGADRVIDYTNKNSHRPASGTT